MKEDREITYDISYSENKVKIDIPKDVFSDYSPHMLGYATEGDPISHSVSMNKDAFEALLLTYLKERGSELLSAAMKGEMRIVDLKNIKVEAIIPVNGERYQAMLSIAENCKKLGVKIPDEVVSFLMNSEAAGKVIKITDEPYLKIENPKDSDKTYLVVDVTAVKRCVPDVELIRFGISGT